MATNSAQLYMQQNPDVLNEYNRLGGTDWSGNKMTADQFAEMHYNDFGKSEGRAWQPAALPQTYGDQTQSQYWQSQAAKPSSNIYADMLAMKSGANAFGNNSATDWMGDATYDASLIPKDFSWQEYAYRNPDLAAAGADTEDEVRKHYALYGIQEGRQWRPEQVALGTGEAVSAPSAPSAPSTGGSGGLLSQGASPAITQRLNEASTIQGRLADILSTDGGGYTNDLVRQAVDRANQSFASRGLLNSSMSAQAGQEAAIAKALEIAGPDAQRAFEQDRANQDWLNKFAEGKTNYGYDIGRIGAQSDAQLKNTALSGSIDLNRLDRQGQIDLQRIAAQGDIDLNRLDKQSALQLIQMGAQEGIDVNKMLLQSGLNIDELQARGDIELVQIDRQSENQIKEIAANSKAQLANTQLSYDKQIEINEINNLFTSKRDFSAAGVALFRDFNSAIQETLSSDLSPEAKESLINQRIAFFKGGMALTGAITGDFDTNEILDQIFGS